MHLTLTVKQWIVVTVLAVLVFASARLQAQTSLNGLDMFGYYQAQAMSYQNEGSDAVNSMSLGQLNLFLKKDFDGGFNAFVNLQLTNSFSSERSWGSFSVEEAWIKYTYSDAFHVKAGLLVPTFNNLNEIKNKTPLLPYVFRPLVYESTVSQVLTQFDYLPERAYFQIDGFVPVGSTIFDYAVYVGNSGTPYLLSNQRFVYPTGTDTSKFKMVGSRVGIRSGSLKAGISGTVDRAIQTWPVFVGDVPRTRFGADFSYSAYGFTLDGEFIKVSNSIDAEKQTTLDMAALYTTDPSTGKTPIGTSLDKKFYYGNLMYDFSEKWYGYAGYSYVDDRAMTYFADGLDVYSFGGGFRPIEPLTLKAQYAHYKLHNTDYNYVNMSSYYLAASVSF